MAQSGFLSPVRLPFRHSGRRSLGEGGSGCNVIKMQCFALEVQGPKFAPAKRSEFNAGSPRQRRDAGTGMIGMLVRLDRREFSWLAPLPYPCN
jgi:hypothetical protein